MQFSTKGITPALHVTLLLVVGALIVTPGCKSLHSGTDKTPKAESDQGEPAFTAFMTQFYEAWIAKDQPKMIALAKNEPNADAYFLRLVEGAESLAMPGLANAETGWSGEELMNSGSSVSVAVALVAATQAVQDHPDLKLSEAQRKAVQRVWVALYQTALTSLGTADEPPPTGVQEAQDKLSSAETISHLLEDTTRQALTLIASAWLKARTGDAQTSAKVKADAATLMHVEEDRLPWPPIIKTDGKYNVAKPRE